jgi:hypothetical protein
MFASETQPIWIGRIGFTTLNFVLMCGQFWLFLYGCFGGWVIHGDRLEIKGVLSRTTIDFSRVRAIDWYSTMGNIKIDGRGIETTLFGHQALQSLVLALWKNCSTAQHQHWEKFCSFREPYAEPDDPNLVVARIRRSRWAWYFVPAAALGCLTALVIGNDSPELVWPLILVVCTGMGMLWLVLALVTPRAGFRVYRQESETNRRSRRLRTWNLMLFNAGIAPNAGP